MTQAATRMQVPTPAQICNSPPLFGASRRRPPRRVSILKGCVKPNELPCVGGCGVQVEAESVDNCSDCARPVVACSDCVLSGVWLTCRRCFDLAADDRLSVEG